MSTTASLDTSRLLRVVVKTAVVLPMFISAQSASAAARSGEYAWRNHIGILRCMTCSMGIINSTKELPRTLPGTDVAPSLVGLSAAELPCQQCQDVVVNAVMAMVAAKASSSFY